MPYQRCGHMGKASAKLVRKEGGLTLHECLCDDVQAKFTHERFRASEPMPVSVEGQVATQLVACCDGCPFKIPSVPQVKAAGAAEVSRFVKATAVWIAAGSPVRTDDEVNQLAAICGECDYFRNGKCTHAMCGCNIKTVEQERHSLLGLVVGAGLFNKLRRATEHCPIEKW